MVHYQGHVYTIDDKIVSEILINDDLQSWYNFRYILDWDFE